MMRREFIALLGGAAAAWPVASRGQQSMPVIGFLATTSASERPHLMDAFKQGLADTGYAEGRNVVIEYRWAEGVYDRFPELASDLLQRRVSVIAAAAGIPAVRAAMMATADIPVVFLTGADPVSSGLVASLNRPGGNVTGVTTLGNEVGPKRLQLLHELVPKATSLALLVNPTNPNADTSVKDLQAAAGAFGVQLEILHAAAEHDLESAFAKLEQRRADGLVIANDPFFISRGQRLAALSLGHAIPSVFYTREFSVAGGLMSYGGSFADAYHQVGVLTGRVLKGEKPSALPVQQSTKVELVINLKTAKALGLEIPPTLLARADEVIE